MNTVVVNNFSGRNGDIEFYGGNSKGIHEYS